MSNLCVCSESLRNIFSNPENQFIHRLETIVMYSSSSKVHKEAGSLLCDYGRYACNLSNFQFV